MPLSIPKRARLVSAAHAAAPKQEKKAAERIGGRLTKASGAKQEKGDARLTGLVRVECKGTIHSSYSVTKKTMDKLEAAVLGSGEVPVLLVELEAGSAAKMKTEFAIVPGWALDLIAEALTKNA
jgi:hypothetical protein